MDCNRTNIVDGLVQSYQDTGGINRIECSNLPSKRTVSVICSDLLQLLFPGYLDEDPVPAAELQAITAARVEKVMGCLEVEIQSVLRLRDGEEAEDGYADEAHGIVCRVLAEVPKIRELLATDVEAAYEGDPAAKNFDEIILAYPCIETIAIQRCAHLLYKANVPLIPRIMTEWAHSYFGIDIHPGATIGSHFFIDHGTGVVIGETCVIGNRVKLYHGVTLGARNFPKDGDGRIVKGNKRHPNVEDGVVIYPNATVLGGETTIGKNSTIGANVFLSRAVPPNSFVTNESEKLRILDKSAPH